MKQLIGFIILCCTLFGCKKQHPDVIVKTITIYRDTCDSEFMRKIGYLESGNTDSLFAQGGKGRYGIYEVCVIGSGLNALLNYSHADMHSKENADRVFWAMMGIFAYQYWQRNGNPPTYEDLARMWAGGPLGYEKAATLYYISKFRKL